MNKFSVFEVNDDKWSEIVKRSKYYDFYHTQSYHLLENENRPILFVVDFENDFIALPLIIREIPHSEYFDCTSVYGYCGPISSFDLDEVSNDILVFFQKELMRFFKGNNIVTAFSRLHPLISNGKIFNNFGTIKDINKTVAIDIRKSPEVQKAQYRRSFKTKLNKLKRNGFEVVEATSREEIDTFISIYTATMKRVCASEYYFFDDNYFYNFLDNKCFQNKLLVAKKDGEIAAGAIFTITNTIMQYHLGGTSEKYIKEASTSLIFDEARLICNDLGLDFLHLGGGLAGSDEDSLFHYKSGFSDYRCMYKVWELIVDQEKYDKLIADKNLANKSNFFPLYREL